MIIVIVSKIVFILSILGILFIISRKIPVLSQVSIKGSSAKRFSFKAAIIWPGTIIKQFILSDFFQNIIVGNLEKSLRKFKIMALKIDNILDKLLRKLKRKSSK